MTIGIANPELNFVEIPMFNQLHSLGWEQIVGSKTDPLITERATFEETLLLDRLCEGIVAVNNLEQEFDEDSRVGKIALIQERVLDMIRGLEDLPLMEANSIATVWLQKGIEIELSSEDGTTEMTIKLIDFENLENNSFIAIRQFRVQPREDNADACEPDLVLFVNGLPLVVIECKRPDQRNLLREAIKQLLRYQNMRVDDDDSFEGVPELFIFTQVTVATTNNQARYGSVGTRASRYLQWKDTYPHSPEDVLESISDNVREEAYHQVMEYAEECGLQMDGPLTAQETLVHGIMTPPQLLDLIKNYIITEEEIASIKKIVPRYMQYRAADRAVERLIDPPEREPWRGEGADPRPDPRGGYIWHTQGSGKSLTMAWIARKMQSMEYFNGWKIVYVTDRSNLEEQLSETPAFEDKSIRIATDIRKLKQYLSDENSGIIFGMIQKMQDPEDVDYVELTDGPEGVVEEGNRVVQRIRRLQFEPLNQSDRILVMVDEAHRSHTKDLHRNLREALPNCAMIAFTGTPIFAEDRIQTEEIFGSEIDSYPIDKAEEDEIIVPIDYEGCQSRITIRDGLDDELRTALEQEITALMEDIEQERPDNPEQLLEWEEVRNQRIENAQREHYSRRVVLKERGVIRMKARHMLRHYVRHIMPNHCKGQLVAIDRESAVFYQEFLSEAHQELVNEVNDRLEELQALTPEQIDAIENENELTLVIASQNIALLERLEFGAVISHEHNDLPRLRRWSRPNSQDRVITEFKKPLVDSDDSNEGNMAIVCVNKMLTTGFSNKITQVMYLDRPMEGHELLQTIARVNRIYEEKNKSAGLVVDYVALHERLLIAYDMYSQGGAEIEVYEIPQLIQQLENLTPELYQFFDVEEITTPEEVENCVLSLSDENRRERFRSILGNFLRIYGRVAYRPGTRVHKHNANRFSFILRSATNRFAEPEDLLIEEVGELVRGIVSAHIEPGFVQPRTGRLRLGSEDFEEYVDNLRSARAQAVQMQHTIQHYITIHMEDDPEHFGSMQERLNEILDEYHEQWEALVEHLRQHRQQTIAGDSHEYAGVSHNQRRFVDILNNPFLDENFEGPSAEMLETNIQIVRRLWPSLRRFSQMTGIGEHIGQEAMKDELFQQMRQLGVQNDERQRDQICDRMLTVLIRNQVRIRDEEE
jgi:type I restriction enzyme, R subunit